MRYLPFLDGKYSVAPGLIPIHKVQDPADKLIFQVDEAYDEYISNKRACRKEDMHKYFCRDKLTPSTEVEINHYIVHKLLHEYPGLFELQNHGKDYLFINHKTGKQIQWRKDWISVDGSQYLCLFDALCCQVQEDFAICQVKGEHDRMAAIHLCAPNHWAAGDKIGKTFIAVHAPVPGMEKNAPHYFKMLLSIIQKGPFTRFAWGMATDKRLNHHPQAPPDIDPVYWRGRAIEKDNHDWYLRVERQNLIGFPDANAFLFTIRTYFYDVASLSEEEKLALLKAVESMSPASLIYKGLNDKIDVLRLRLA